MERHRKAVEGMRAFLLKDTMELWNLLRAIVFIKSHLYTHFIFFQGVASFCLPSLYPGQSLVWKCPVPSMAAGD